MPWLCCLRYVKRSPLCAAMYLSSRWCSSLHSSVDYTVIFEGYDRNWKDERVKGLTFFLEHYYVRCWNSIKIWFSKHFVLSVKAQLTSSGGSSYLLFECVSKEWECEDTDRHYVRTKHSPHLHSTRTRVKYLQATQCVYESPRPDCSVTYLFDLCVMNSPICNDIGLLTYQRTDHCNHIRIRSDRKTRNVRGRTLL